MVVTWKLQRPLEQPPEPLSKLFTPVLRGVRTPYPSAWRSIDKEETRQNGPRELVS